MKRTLQQFNNVTIYVLSTKSLNFVRQSAIHIVCSCDVNFEFKTKRSTSFLTEYREWMRLFWRESRKSNGTIFERDGRDRKGPVDRLHNVSIFKNKYNNNNCLT